MIWLSQYQRILIKLTDSFAETISKLFLLFLLCSNKLEWCQRSNKPRNKCELDGKENLAKTFCAPLGKLTNTL